MSTGKTMDMIKSGNKLDVDATFLLVWQGYPILGCGVSSPTGKFFGSLFSLLKKILPLERAVLIHSQLGQPLQVEDGGWRKELTKEGIEVRQVLLLFL